MHKAVDFRTESTSAAGRHIVSEALAKVDPVGSREAAHDTNWRRHYVHHFRRLTEAGIGRPHDAVLVAHEGLLAARDEFSFGGRDLDDACSVTGEPLGSPSRIAGIRTRERAVSLPYRGERLTGSAIIDQAEQWADAGIITASCRDAIADVVAHPEWLDLRGETFVMLGAGAEMGPYQALSRWGARIVAVDLDREPVQERIAQVALDGAGTTEVIAANMLHDLPALAQRLLELDGRIVLGNYCYADGGTHVRLSMAADTLATHLLKHRPNTALAFLATPTDAFVVPAEEVQRSASNYAGTSRARRMPLRTISGGRLLRRNYPPKADPGLADAIVPQQGPNYALAKRIQRWRATQAAHDGHLVSLNVAPATRTRSVVKNRALAAAYAGAHRFGVEVFDPATSNVLMAMLLLHDLRADVPLAAEPWQDEARGAAHGGLWTTAYSPRSALGLAAVLGLGSARN